MDVDEVSGLTVELYSPWIPQRGHLRHLRICVRLYQNLVRWPMFLICKLSIGARSLVCGRCLHLCPYFVYAIERVGVAQ